MSITLAEFIQQYGNDAQVILADPFGNQIVYATSEVISSPNLFQEIVQGTRTITGSYQFPLTPGQVTNLGLIQIPPYQILPSTSAYPSDALQVLTNRLMAKVQAVESKIEDLNESLISRRNFLLNQPYTVSFTDVAPATPVLIANVSSSVDPRLTDGDLTVETFSQATPIAVAGIEDLFFTIINPNIQADIFIPLPDNAYLGDFVSSSITALDQGAGTLPSTIEIILYTHSVVSENAYQITYTVSGEQATPVYATPDSFLQRGINFKLYQQVGSGVGSVFHGEPVENFRVDQIQYIFTTTPGATQSFLDAADCIFHTTTATVSIIGNGVSGAVALWSSATSLTYDPGITYSSGTIAVSSALVSEGTLSVGPLVGNGVFRFSSGHLQISEAGGAFYNVNKKFAQTVSGLNATVTHNLNTTDVIVQAYDISAVPSFQVQATISVVDANNIAIVFNQSETSVRVVVLG